MTPKGFTAHFQWQLCRTLKRCSSKNSDRLILKTNDGIKKLQKTKNLQNIEWQNIDYQGSYKHTNMNIFFKSLILSVWEFCEMRLRIADKP